MANAFKKSLVYITGTCRIAKSRSFDLLTSSPERPIIDVIRGISRYLAILGTRILD